MPCNSTATITAWLLLATCCLMTRCEGSTCMRSQNMESRLTIQSRRNDSGHWVSQVELAHPDPDSRGGRWNVDVQDRTFSCGVSNGSDKGFVVISAKLVSPRLEEATNEANRTHPNVAFDSVIHLANLDLEIFLTKTHLSWSDARRACEGRNMKLAEVSAATIRSLITMLKMKTLRRGFVDLRRSPYVPHEFRTTSGDVFESSDIGWMDGHPVSQGPLVQDACVAAVGLPVMVPKYLEDVSCEHKLPFFCERPFKIV